MLSGDVFVSTLKMPDDFDGNARCFASGTSDDGIYHNSNAVSVLVKPDLSKLVELKFDMESPAICVADRSVTTRVIGVFSDGREYSLSDPRLGGAISLGDHSLAKIRSTMSGRFSEYGIACHTVGETEIVATNSGISASLPLIIIPWAKNPNFPTSADLPRPPSKN